MTPACVFCNEEQRELLAHAKRMFEGALDLRRLLSGKAGRDAHETAAEHEREGDKAAWMHAFAILLHRVAESDASFGQSSTGFAVALAVEGARDAYAHWATALELRARVEAA